MAVPQSTLAEMSTKRADSAYAEAEASAHAVAKAPVYPSPAAKARLQLSSAGCEQSSSKIEFDVSAQWDSYKPAQTAANDAETEALKAAAKAEDVDDELAYAHDPE